MCYLTFQYDWFFHFLFRPVYDASWELLYYKLPKNLYNKPHIVDKQEVMISIIILPIHDCDRPHKVRQFLGFLYLVLTKSIVCSLYYQRKTTFRHEDYPILTSEGLPTVLL